MQCDSEQQRIILKVAVLFSNTLHEARECPYGHSIRVCTRSSFRLEMFASQGERSTKCVQPGARWLGACVLSDPMSSKDTYAMTPGTLHHPIAIAIAVAIEHVVATKRTT